MRRNLLLYLIFVFALSLGAKNVYAKCTYADKAALNKEVGNVKVRYEAAKEAVMPEGWGCDGEEECQPYRHYININVLNLSENFYVDIKNSVTKKSQKYYYSQVPEDGILKIEWDDVTQINTFTITVYASDKTSCPDTKLKVTHVTTPRRNEFSENSICEEVPNYYLCREYVTYENDPTFAEFQTAVEKEIEKQREENKKKKEKGFFEKLLEFIGKYKIAIIVVAVVIMAVVTGIVIIVRKKKEL